MSLEVRRKICAIGIVIGVYLGFRYVVPVAVPFLIGWLLAVWVYPAGEWIERKIHLKKSWAGAVILVGLLTLFLLLLWKGGILLWEQIKLIFLNFHNLSDWGMRILDQCCQAAEQVTGIKKEVSRQFILTQAGQMQRNLMESVTPQSFLKLISEAGEIFLVGMGFLITWLSGILFLQEMDSVKRKVRESSVLRGVRRIARRLKETTITYLKAQLVIKGVIGLISTL